MATNAYRAPPTSEFAWWKLTPKQKRVLQQRRVYGEYGGETAASVGRAPYFWAQEEGSAAANIIAQGFAGRAVTSFRAKAHEVLKSVAE